jgi:hypothetical protein
VLSEEEGAPLPSFLGFCSFVASSREALSDLIDRYRSIEGDDRYKSIDQGSESIYTIDFEACAEPTNEAYGEDRLLGEGHWGAALVADYWQWDVKRPVYSHL